MKITRGQLQKLIKESLLITENTKYKDRGMDFDFDFTDPVFWKLLTQNCNFAHVPISYTTTIIIDKTSLPEVTVSDIINDHLKDYGGADLTQHLKPMHGLKHPRIKIAEYLGEGKYVYNGKEYEDGGAVPWELCGDTEMGIGGKARSGYRNDTGIIVLHDGESKPGIRNRCGEFQTVYKKHVPGKSSYDIFDAQDIYFPEMYNRVLDLIMKADGMEAYRK